MTTGGTATTSDDRAVCSPRGDDDDHYYDHYKYYNSYCYACTSLPIGLCLRADEWLRVQSAEAKHLPFGDYLFEQPGLLQLSPKRCVRKQETIQKPKGPDKPSRYRYGCPSGSSIQMAAGPRRRRLAVLSGIWGTHFTQMKKGT